jgi:hypothetical protein
VIKEQHPRIKREKKTIDAMVRYYCKKKHQTKGDLCHECTDFLAYAMMRLDKCPSKRKAPAAFNPLLPPRHEGEVKIIMRTQEKCFCMSWQRYIMFGTGEGNH